MQVIHMKNICYFNTNQFCFQFMKEPPVRFINSPAQNFSFKSATEECQIKPFSKSTLSYIIYCDLYVKITCQDTTEIQISVKITERFSKIPHFKYFLTKEKNFPPFITERIMLSHILHQNFDSAKTDSKLSNSLN